MKVIIVNYETKKVINTLELKGKVDTSIFQMLNRIENMQRETDILKVDKLGKANFGIRSMFQHGLMHSSMDANSTVEITGANSYTISTRATYGKDTTPDNLKVGDDDMGIKIGVIIYDVGWVLSSGKVGSDILGRTYTPYLASIGTRNIRCNDVSHARIFPTLKSVRDYIEKKRDVFEFCVSQYGYNWSIEATCETYQGELDNLSGKKREKYQTELASINDMLDDINNREPENEFDMSNMPEEVTDEALFDEVIYRMKKLQLWDEIIKNYRKDKTIYQSEAGGIIYELDDDAKVAIKSVIEDDKIPYHVVKNTTTFGVVYSVLYVSKNLSEWKWERGNNDGIIMNYCYNSTEPTYSEYGDSRFIAANGGLKRIE